MKKIVIISFLVTGILAFSACGEDTQDQLNAGDEVLPDDDFEAAIDDSTQAIEEEPDSAEAYIERALAYIDMGETEENLEAAREDFEAALEIDEGNVEAELGLADVYIREGKYDMALDILQEGSEESDGDEAIEEKIAEFDSDEVYDSSGNVRRRVGRDANGEMIWYHELTYDEKGREASVTSYDINGNETGHVDLEYIENENDWLCPLVYYTYSHPTVVDSAALKSGDYVGEMPGTVTRIEFIYDDEGNFLREERYDANGTLDYFITSEYNSAGRPVKEQWHYNDDDIEEYRTEYDENGNRVKYSYYLNDELVYYDIYENDKDGREIKMISYNADDDVTSYCITEWDSNGNRIKQSIYDENNVLDSYIV